MAEQTLTPAAESSTAAPEVQPAAEFRNVVTFTDSERLEWRKTGKAPQPKANDAEGNESSDATGDRAESAAASEAASTTQGKKRDNASTRIPELLSDRKQKDDRIKQLEADLAEARKPKTEKPAAESSTAPAPAPVKALEAPKKPDIKDFDGKDPAEFEAAWDKYIDDLTTYKAESAVQRDRQAQAEKQQLEQLEKKMAESRQRYGADYDEIVKPTTAALQKDLEKVPAVNQMIGSSEVFTDLLYVLGGDKAKFQQFISTAQANPAKAIRALVKMEMEIEAELAKGKGAKPAAEEGKGERTRGTDGKFKAGDVVDEEAEETQRITSRGKPPAEIGGHEASPGDDSPMAAMKRGNFEDYQTRQNAKDMAKLKR